jgi:hypothetical protein
MATTEPASPPAAKRQRVSLDADAEPADVTDSTPFTSAPLIPQTAPAANNVDDDDDDEEDEEEAVVPEEEDHTRHDMYLDTVSYPPTDMILNGQLTVPDQPCQPGFRL